MAKQHPAIPFGLFSHAPVQLSEYLEERNCLSPRTFCVMQVLFQMIDFNETYVVHDRHYFKGITRPISRDGIGKRCGMSGRTVYEALQELVSADVIRSLGAVGQCPYYHIVMYDEAIKYLLNHPNHPITSVDMPKGSEDTRKRIQEESATAEEISTPPVQDSPPTMEDSATFLDKDIKELPSLNTNGDSTRMSESNEREGDFSNQEEPEEVITFNEGEADIQPTKQIADVTDMLASAKGMTPNDDEQSPVWAFMNVFKRPDGEEWKQSDVQSATILRERFESVLETHSLNITPIRFFEHCLTETDNWIADGKVDVAPSSFNFYLNAATGKQIVECVAEKLKAENAAQTSADKSKAWLDEQKEFKREGIPPAAQAMMDELLGREDASDI